MQQISPIKAIRKKCLQCSADNPVEVRECTVKGCALYDFRMGKNPNRKPISEERRQMLSERAKKYGFKKKEEQGEKNE